MTMAAKPLHAVPPTDGTLVEQTLAGDGRAFVALYDRHARYVASVVARLMGGDDGELEDVVQDAFISASRDLARLDDRERFRPWLVSIACHHVYRRLARRRRRNWFRWVVGETTPQVSDPRDREPVNDLVEALNSLPPKLRIPWVLHHVEGETLDAVAQMCDVSLATVKRRIAAAGSELERCLRAG